MIERIDRAHHEFDVALGIDIVERLPGDLARVLHIDVLIHHHDDFRKHGLAGAPDRVHHFARVAGIRLADGHQNQVMEDALGRHRDIAHFRQLQPHQRQENAFDGLAHVIVFHGRRPHDGGRVNRFFAVRDGSKVKDRVPIFQRIKTGVIAERAFGAQLAQFDVSFEHDFGLRRHLQVAGLALHHLDGALSQEAGDHHLVQVRRQRQDRRVHADRIGADRHGDIHARLPVSAHTAVMLGALLVGLPVHAGGDVVVNLHAIHAAVALAGIGVARKHHRQGDEAAAIFGPAFENRELGQRHAGGAHHFLARAFGNDLGKEPAHLGQLGQHFQLADQTFRHAHLEELDDARRDLFHRIHFQRDFHFAQRSVSVDEHGHIRAGGLFE